MPKLKHFVIAETIVIIVLLGVIIKMLSPWVERGVSMAGEKKLLSSRSHVRNFLKVDSLRIKSGQVKSL